MIEHLLRDATRRQRRSTAIAIGLAMVAALAGVALLALSGWFLTGAAIAGAGCRGRTGWGGRDPVQRGDGRSVQPDNRRTSPGVSR